MMGDGTALAVVGCVLLGGLSYGRPRFCWIRLADGAAAALGGLSDGTGGGGLWRGSGGMGSPPKKNTNSMTRTATAVAIIARSHLRRTTGLWREACSWATQIRRSLVRLATMRRRTGPRRTASSINWATYSARRSGSRPGTRLPPRLSRYPSCNVKATGSVRLTFTTTRERSTRYRRSGLRALWRMSRPASIEGPA